MNYIENFEEAERIDKLRSKMLKYILYKKRTEQEVRQKFSDENENDIEDAIEYFKEQKYIDDEDYVKRAVKEFMTLRNLSLKEIEYKICQKGINDFVCKNKEDMLEYEIASAKAIIMKKQNKLEENEIRDYLYKKGYMSESVNIAFDDINI